MDIANYGMSAVRILGSLTLKQVENVAIRKILKIGVLQCFKVAKMQPRLSKKPYGENS